MYNILREDFKLNSFRSFLTLFFYRIINKFYQNKNFYLVKILNFLYSFVKLFFSLHSQISYKSTIGRRIRLPHIGFGVIISAKATIGNDVTIFHLVTIGINEFKCKKQDLDCVEIGNNCYLSAGAKIISSKVGNGSVIGPNAVVYQNIKENSKIFNMVNSK